MFVTWCYELDASYFFISDHSVSKKFYYDKYKLVYCKKFIFIKHFPTPLDFVQGL